MNMVRTNAQHAAVPAVINFLIVCEASDFDFMLTVWFSRLINQEKYRKMLYLSWCMYRIYRSGLFLEVSDLNLSPYPSGLNCFLLDSNVFFFLYKFSDLRDSFQRLFTQA